MTSTGVLLIVLTVGALATVMFSGKADWWRRKGPR